MPFSARPRIGPLQLPLTLRARVSMGFKCGIVGLPNVGKSTLFNALTQTAAAQAANYPFCTIEPNVGDVAVPDPRLDALAEIASSKEIIPTRLTFVDIAGLVRGASKGEGLGNQFLANIRECDAIAHVVRCFEDGDVTHVEGRIDPLSDIATIETELMLADLESLERRIVADREEGQGRRQGGQGAARARRAQPRRAARGPPGARRRASSRDERKLFQSLGLLSSKPVLYVCNVEEASADKGNALFRPGRASRRPRRARPRSSSRPRSRARSPCCRRPSRRTISRRSGSPSRASTASSAPATSSCISSPSSPPGRRRRAPGRSRRARRAPQAAGVIHTDFEKGFIRAETIAYDDYVAFKGEAGAREAGKFRLEGKDYVVADGDVMHFRFAN